MSQPKEYYYSSIKKWIMMYDYLPDDRPQVQAFRLAFEKAIKATAEMANGELRIYAIESILIDKTKTYEGVAQELHYERRTVQGWITSFVNLVGGLAGY